METTNKYNDLLEELRFRYKQKYGKIIDDDLLILIVRMNELEVSVKTQIEQIQHPNIESKFDLFCFTLGKKLSIATIIIMIINIITLICILFKVI